jgi:glycosyltransferase involved in cell wall biosynthesis
MEKIISVLILTHNAPDYVEETIVTLNEITQKEDRESMEIIVLDNASEDLTKEILLKLKEKNYIDKLHFSNVNTLFAKGNNLASELASKSSKYYLLLNSDIKINHPQWLQNLLKLKEKEKCNAISYGVCFEPVRCDGYCFLIERELYDFYRLDESFEWFWSITKIQAQLLRDGYSLVGIKNHNKYLYHYGGKSGFDFLGAKGMDIQQKEVLSWYGKKQVKVLDFFKLLTIYSKIKLHLLSKTKKIINAKL